MPHTIESRDNQDNVVSQEIVPRTLRVGLGVPQRSIVLTFCCEEKTETSAHPPSHPTTGLLISHEQALLLRECLDKGIQDLANVLEKDSKT